MSICLFDNAVCEVMEARLYRGFVNEKYFYSYVFFGLALSFKVWRIYKVFEISAPFVIFV